MNYRNYKHNSTDNITPTNQGYGSIMRSTREKHGLSLSEVSAELRVREDILIALENGDFSKIPPQGYSRNMIKSYSRILGLNATKMTNLFLDAEYAYRVGKKRKSMEKISAENRKRISHYDRYSGSTRTARDNYEELSSRRAEMNKLKQDDQGNSSRFNRTTSRENIEGPNTVSRSRRFDNDYSSYSKGESTSPIKKGRMSHTMENIYTNTPRARKNLDSQKISKSAQTLENTKLLKNDLFNGGNHDSAQSRLEARRKSNLNMPKTSGYNRSGSAYGRASRMYGQRHVIDRVNASKFTDEENPNFIKNQDPKNFKPVSDGKYNFMNVYNSKNANKKNLVGLQKINIFLISGIVVVLVIVLILVLFFIGKQQENSKTDVSNISVTGLTDPEKNQNPETNQNTVPTNPTAEPTEVEFVYKIKDGKSAYIEIYENNSAKPTSVAKAKSGDTQTYKVTNTLKFVTTSVDAVDLTVAGQKVEAKDINGTGVYTYTCDFAAYLADWKAKNGTTATPTSPTAPTNNNANTSGSTTNQNSTNNQQQANNNTNNNTNNTNKKSSSSSTTKKR